MAFHAFFGLALMTGTGLLMADWFGSMGRTWGVSAIVDQQTGGGIAWSIGEIPTVILAITVAIQWSMSDKKLTKRLDRKADRTNDAELSEYNRMLERLERKP
jgi:cytochrome c oxidase assembly factor CtaG